MKLITLILCIVSSSYALMTSATCRCTDLVTELDCSYSVECKWNTACYPKMCSDYTTQKLCDQQPGCAWTNDQTCDAFTMCEDYIVINPDLCYKKNQICVPGQLLSYGFYVCQPGTVVCQNVEDPTICSGLMQVNSLVCYYEDDKCQGFDIHACSAITTQTVCDTYDCFWSTTNSSCSGGLCSAYTSESDCTFVSAENIGFSLLCSWNNGECAEATDISSRTESNCIESTGGSFGWINGECLECPGTADSILLSILSIVFIF